MTNHANRLVVYLRTSTQGNADSFESQLAACEEWAGRVGSRIVSVHTDRGLSGRLTPEERPGLADALARIENGEADGLLVHRLDRLARELHVQEAVLARAWTHDGRVYEAVEGEIQQDDPEDPYRRFVRQVMGAAAELERGLIAARLRRGRVRKRERGGYAGGPTVPYGLRVEGEGKDARLVPDEEVAPMVQRIERLRDEDDLTLAAIATRLNAEGVPTARGGRWHPTSVQRVLARAAA
jgi:DNA invertase Pin-like site-specific DNA recombinase